MVTQIGDLHPTESLAQAFRNIQLMLSIDILECVSWLQPIDIFPELFLIISNETTLKITLQVKLLFDLVNQANQVVLFLL